MSKLERILALGPVPIVLAALLGNGPLIPRVVDEPAVAALEIVAPKSGSDASCTLTRRDGGKIVVSGTSAGLYEKDAQLLLYLNPQHPHATGWYLQFGLNGVHSFFDDGTWQGVAQLGNGTYPPKGGEIISIAVVALPEKEAAIELKRAREDPGRPRPGGLPRATAGHSAIAKNVRIVLEKSR